MIKKTLLLLAYFPLFLLGQNSFINQFTNSNWMNERDSLRFLETVNDNKKTYKAVTSTSYIFYIDLLKDTYSTKELIQNRQQCCMCSYNSILDTKDTLKIENYSTDDFGNSELVTNTFYIKNKKLVQIKIVDNNSARVTIWTRLFSDAENVNHEK